MKDSCDMRPSLPLCRVMNTMEPTSGLVLATAQRIILAVATSIASGSFPRLPVPLLSLLRSEQHVTGLVYIKPGSSATSLFYLPFLDTGKTTP